MKKAFNTLFLLTFLCFLPAAGYAQDAQELEEPYVSEPHLIYEKPTMTNLSQLYWALSKLDIEDDANIDNFMLINECDIYKDYFNHEFEWKDVRKSAREFIQENKKNFPLRFEFVQEVKLGEYDLQKQEFEILDDFKIDGIRRFTVDAIDAYDEICQHENNIRGYPGSFILELSRPFVFTELPLSSEKAHVYITEKMEGLRDYLDQKQTKELVYDNRDVYVIMKVKMFAYNGDERVRGTGYIPNILGVLESFEVYGDPERRNLFYSKSYRKRRTQSSMEEELKEKYKKQESAAEVKADSSETDVPEEQTSEQSQSAEEASH